MSDKSNKYGYVGVDIPAQSFGSNKGVFNPAEINELVANNQWTTFGQLELIETQTASSVSYLDFLDIKENIYNVHFMTFNNVIFGTADTLGFQLYENGTLETGSVYQYATQYGYASGTFGEDRITAQTFLVTGNANTTSQNGYIYGYNFGDSTKYSFMTQHSTNNETSYLMRFGSGVLPQASVVNGIRHKGFSGNTFSGTFSLYGIRYS